MEYKLFGAARQPPEDFRDDLAAFCHLDEEQRNTIADWFLSTDDFDLYAPQLPPMVVESTLLPEQFRQTAGVIGSLLSDWHSRGLELRDVERDLLLLGCDSTQVSILSAVLDRLTPVKERVWIAGRRDLERSTGLPTIDDVNIVWNARPVFGADAVYYYGSDSLESSYDKFLGLVYLATMEISASDSSGNEQRIAVQIDERTFRLLLEGMKRAGDQLKKLKIHTRGTVAQSEGLGQDK